MGNLIGLESGIDSIECIDTTIKSLVYVPPSDTVDSINYLSKIAGNRAFNLMYHKLTINVLEITPSKILFNDKIIIFSHGNGSDNSHMFDYLSLLANSLGIIVVSYDYPGYGLSQGETSEKTCNLSLAIVIWHYINKYTKILLVGQSLGTGIVLDYASNSLWSNPIMLISPYKSIPKVMFDFDFIESCVVNNKFSSYSKLKNIVCPVKIFHGTNDKTINISHSIDLYKNLPNKTLKPKWYNNTGHNNILEKIEISEYVNLLNLL